MGAEILVADHRLFSPKEACSGVMPSTTQSLVSTQFFYPTTSMNNFQHFSHRPPSNTTLLHDPWPPELPLHKTRKPKFGPIFFQIQNLARVRSPEGVTGLRA